MTAGVGQHHPDGNLEPLSSLCLCPGFTQLSQDTEHLLLSEPPFLKDKNARKRKTLQPHSFTAATLRRTKSLSVFLLPRAAANMSHPHNSQFLRSAPHARHTHTLQTSNTPLPPQKANSMLPKRLTSGCRTCVLLDMHPFRCGHGGGARVETELKNIPHPQVFLYRRQQ